MGGKPFSAREGMALRERNKWQMDSTGNSSFPGKYPDGDPLLSPDGEKLFIYRKGLFIKSDTDIWNFYKNWFKLE
jgi:hypothetical protein